jgi:hypothetical protein
MAPRGRKCDPAQQPSWAALCWEARAKQSEVDCLVQGVGHLGRFALGADVPSSLLDTFARLCVRDIRRTEAEVQADVRQFILDAPFELEEDDLSLVRLESQLGDRRRIDVEVGATVIEVKRDLRVERIRREAEDQLAGYVAVRAEQTGLRYVGILTDGTAWFCYHLVDGTLGQIS